MTRLNQLVTCHAAVAPTFLANVSGATPLSRGADAIIGANAMLNIIEQVHGTYRACVRGWISRWHRHVGLANVPIRC